MTREEIIKNLKYTMEKHKNDRVPTFGTNISVMCKDILDYLEQEPKEITLEDVKEYCEPRCLTIISNALLYELTHPKIKALEQEPRWISVSERLPTKEEYIANNGLFIVSDDNRTYAEYFDVYNSMKYFGEPTMNGFRVDRCVIAWMPLPEPYEPQAKEDK